MVRKISLALIVVIIFLCVGITAVSFITNRRLPTDAMDAAQLSALDKARLAEALHLRQTLGNELWPGWGEADIPMIVYNDAYAFLVGYEDPPPGWIKVPQQEQRGSPWEPVAGDDFQGQPYYRTLLPENGQTPEAFTVLVGDRWASSLQTRPAMRVMMANQFRDMLPGSIDPVLPYTLAADLFLRNSDSYVALMLHESFHAFEGLSAPQRLLAGEMANIRYQDAYPYQEEAFVADWQAELDLLTAALQAEDDAETADLVQQFLANRAARREAAGLAETLIAYEQQREWVEGMALYTELAILRLANAAAHYQPVEALAADPEFEHYENFTRRWQQEVAQISRMAAEDGDGRFYYSGMAQAVLLDRLLPEWKTQIFDEGVFLEDLLATAVP